MEVRVPDDLVADPLLICGEDGNIDHLNPAAGRVFGTATHLTDLDVDLDDARGLLGRAARSTGLTPARLQTGVSTDEPRTWVAWGRRLSADDPRVAVRLEDVARTSFRKLSRQLDSLHAEVARRMSAEQELHELIDDTLARLQRANDALTRYASSVAHDLRSPLSAIRGFAGLIADTAEGEELDLTRAIARNATQALDMVEGLLADSAGTGATEEVDLEEVVAWATDSLATLIRDSGSRVVVGRLPRVSATCSTTRHVFYNLLRNAVQHRGTDHQVRIEVTGERVADTWRISVSDDGPGVAEDAREDVFRRGVRLRPHETEGHGLGLGSCRSAVRDLGGDLHVEDSERGGARFVVTLPA